MPGEQLLLINPRRRRVKKSHRRRAKNSRRRHRHAGGFRIRRRRVKNPRSHKRHRRHRNPIMRKHRRRHRNPLSVSGVKNAIVPALMGAAGGVAVDYAFQFAAPYLPTSLTTGVYVVPVMKLGVAFGLGLAARKFLGSEKGNAVMAGALAIQAYNLIASILGGTAGLAGFGAYLTPNAPTQPYSSSVSRNGLGSPNPASYLQRPMGRIGRIGRVGAYMTPMSGLPFNGLGSLGGTQADMEMFS
jgi:hypothetical protein